MENERTAFVTCQNLIRKRNERCEGAENQTRECYQR